MSFLFHWLVAAATPAVALYVAVSVATVGAPTPVRVASWATVALAGVLGGMVARRPASGARPSVGASPAASPAPVPDDPTGDAPPIAFPTLLASVDGDVRLYALLGADARDGLAEARGALKEALREGGLADAVLHAHTLRTLASLLGADGLTGLAADLQAAADAGRAADAVETFVALHAEASSVLTRLDAEVARLPHAAVPALAVDA